MEPLSTASAFATIIGLIGQFRTERKSNPGDIEEFLSWSETKDIEIRSLVQDNTQISVGIKALLARDRANLLSRLSSIDHILSLIASNISEFSTLAGALNPGGVLSRQAMSIVDQMELGRVSKVLKCEDYDGAELMVLEGDSRVINFDDKQFLDDDLLTLVECGLLRLSYNDSSGEIYTFTRQAKALVIETRKS